MLGAYWQPNHSLRVPVNLEQTWLFVPYWANIDARWCSHIFYTSKWYFLMMTSCEELLKSENGICCWRCFREVSGERYMQLMTLNRLKFSGINQAYRNALIPLFCLVWSIVHLLGVLQQILVFHCCIGICVLLDFLFLVLVLITGTNTL